MRNLEVIKKGFINVLTLIRIPLTILFIILFNTTDNKVPQLTILSLIILSDFIDGKIARKFNIQSKIGSILDPYCDLFFVLCTSILFNIYNLVSITYTFILIFKFAEFNITSYYAGMSSNKIPFMFDKVGRVVTALYQVVPFVVVIPLLSQYCSAYIAFLVIGTLISSTLRICTLMQPSIIILHKFSSKKREN